MDIDDTPCITSDTLTMMKDTPDFDLEHPSTFYSKCHTKCENSSTNTGVTRKPATALPSLRNVEIVSQFELCHTASRGSKRKNANSHMRSHPSNVRDIESGPESQKQVSLEEMSQENMECSESMSHESMECDSSESVSKAKIEESMEWVESSNESPEKRY